MAKPGVDLGHSDLEALDLLMVVDHHYIVIDEYLAIINSIES